MTHATLLRKALAIKGESKTELAKALGVSKQHIHNWFLAGRIPPWRMGGVLELIQREKDK